MTGPMDTSGLRLDQAPPLAVPATYFVTAPLFVAAAGGLLLWKGSLVLLAGAVPATLLFTHLGTLGFLTMTMFGALYQMAPVVAGRPVPKIRLAWLTYALLLLGLGTLAPALLAFHPLAINLAFSTIWLAVALFLGHAGLAVLKSGVKNHTVAGMRAALAFLLVAATLGSVMAHRFTGSLDIGPPALWLQVHLGVALFGWVGGLLAAVSWQVVPMFYLAPPWPAGARRAVLLLLVTGVLLPGIVLLVERLGLRGAGALAPSRMAAVAALPAVVAAWVVHPLLTLRSFRDRRRKRPDPSLLYWKAGLAAAFLAAATAAAAPFVDDPRPALLLGWLAIWGWAGLVVHGMLTRIVPFLVWFHRWSSRVGLEPTPSMRSLFGDRRSHLGLLLHLLSVALGAAAIVTRSDLAARVTGALLVLTGLALFRSLLGALGSRPGQDAT